MRYENSLICAKCKPIFFQSLKEGIQPVGVGVWRHFSQLVMTKDAQLPDRCTVCNAPANGLRLKRNLYWHPPAWYLLICAGLLFYAIAALIVRKKASIEIGLCRYSSSKTEKSDWHYMVVNWCLYSCCNTGHHEICNTDSFGCCDFYGCSHLWHSRSSTGNSSKDRGSVSLS